MKLDNAILKVYRRDVMKTTPYLKFIGGTL